MLKVFKQQTKQVEQTSADRPSLSWLGRFKQGMQRVLSSHPHIDDELLEELETQLLQADVGVEASSDIIQHLKKSMTRKQVIDADTLLSELKQQLIALLEPCQQPLVLDKQCQPYVTLVIGVNGSGKTTTIAKMAHYFKQQGNTVMLAAGDTFRAAAIEQLQLWGKRYQVPVIAQHAGADSASVVYDSLQAARARQIGLVLADTAGRLHTQQHLMEELKKVKRVIGKFDDTAPHEVLLVLDATIGQNALNQALAFDQDLGVTGLALTKLDGSAKGGIIFAIAKQLSLPIRFIGVGERAEDLQVFNAETFVNTIFGSPD